MGKMTVVHTVYGSILFYIFSILTIRLARSLEEGYCYNLNREVCCANFENISGTCRECLIGFSSNLGESCYPCAYRKFGRKCAFECQCKIRERCDSISGSCAAQSEITTFSGKKETLLFTESTVTTWTDNEIVTVDDITHDVTDKKTIELTGRETILVFLLSLSGLVIILGVVYECCKMKRTVFLRTSSQKEQIVAQSERRTVNDTNSAHERQIGEVNIYEIIDETAMIDVLPINLTINMGESSYHSQLANTVEAESRNLNLQRNRSSVTTLKSDTVDFGAQISKQHVSDETSGSESSACEGYLNPYQLVTMNTENPHHDYSVLAERKYMTILDPNMIMQTDNCHKPYSTAHPKANKKQCDTDETSGSESSACEGYLNPYQSLTMKSEKPRLDYSVLTERKYMTMLDPKIYKLQQQHQMPAKDYKKHSIAASRSNTNQMETDMLSGSV